MFSLLLFLLQLLLRALAPRQSIIVKERHKGKRLKQQAQQQQQQQREK
jgi:hypothetical protein